MARATDLLIGSDDTDTESENNEPLNPRGQNYAYVGEIDEEALNRARGHVVRANANMERFLEEIARRESQGQPNQGYGAVGSGSADRRALGKYQMQKDALVDAGLRRKDGSWIGVPGVDSEAEFLTNKQAQEEAIRRYIGKVEGYLRHNGSVGYVNQRVNGTAGAFAITEAGLVAAALRAGHDNIKNYLEHTQKNNWNSDFSKLSPDDQKMFKWIETRLREFEKISYR